MGIKGLMNIIDDEAPGARKEHELKNYTGRKIAIDASMAMYQFLVAVRSAEQSGQAGAMLTNDAGEVTSHIQGLFNRTIRFMTAGVQPVYVFDGKPPSLKSGELAKRTKMRTEAQENLKKAEAADDAENVDKFSKRLVKITRQHNEDAKKLLRLMGVPVVEAPCEAEAQCAELAKGGAVYAAATEDMDTLTFATPHLVRKMNVAASRKEPLVQIDYDKILAGLELTKEQFIDLCILCGCDYCDRPAGIGPKTALKLIRKHGNLETIIRFMATKKHPLPPGWFKPKDYDANAAKSDPRTADKDLADAAAASDMSGPSEEGAGASEGEGEGASASSSAAAEEASVAVEEVTVEMEPAEPKEEEEAAAAAVKLAAEEAAADGLVDTDDEAEPIKDAAATDDAKPMEVVEATPAVEAAAEKASPGAKAVPSTDTEAMDVVEVEEASAGKASPAKASAGSSLTGKKKKQGDINTFFNAPNPKKQKQAGLGAFFGAQSKSSSSASKPAPKPAAAASKPAAASPSAAASSSSSSESMATPAAAAEEPAPAMTSKKGLGAQNAHLSEPDEDGWQPIFVEVRKLFEFPEVTPAAEVELKWTDCDEAELLKFLVEDMGFSADRVLPGIKRLKEAKKQSSQKRMDSFFKVMPGAPPKKKAPEPAKGKGKGKGKGKAGGKFRR